MSHLLQKVNLQLQKCENAASPKNIHCQILVFNPVA